MSTSKISTYARANSAKIATVGSIMFAISFIILFASASAAVEIKKAETCDKYPKKAWQMSTAIAVLSSLSLLLGIGVIGGAYGFGRKSGSAQFYRFNF